MAKKTAKKDVRDITHDEAKRPNIPTSEMKPLVDDSQKAPIKVSFEKRNPDLDPQLIWRGKYDGDETLTVKAPPLYIQEKVHPKALIEDLKSVNAKQQGAQYLSLFGDFNGMPKGVDKTDFYKHEQNWTNRMILGDSLQVMASLAEREKLRGKVQMIYIDPPYGIKFNSNFQFSTNSRDVKDGKDYTREPEQVKAFRDTWEDGIHSYLSYLRDRLIVARDLLTGSGSIFVQIGDENVHLVRTLMDEVFGKENYCALIIFKKSARTASLLLPKENDYILWFGKNKDVIKYNPLFVEKTLQDIKSYKYIISKDTNIVRPATKKEILNPDSIENGFKLCQVSFVVSGDPGKKEDRFYSFHDKVYDCGAHRHYKTSPKGLDRLVQAQRLVGLGSQLNYIRYFDDFPIEEISTCWEDTGSAGFSNSDPKVYVVQTDTTIIQRCMLMTTDPGELVLDPTCGSGTTAYVAEQWGRRWITIDTSRVALALARARLMGTKYPFYLMADSREGQQKEAEISGTPPSGAPCGENVAMGFVYERVPHITLKSIANNVQIDEIWNRWQPALEDTLKQLNEVMGENWQEWEVPRYAESEWPEEAKELFYKLKATREGKINPMPSGMDIKNWFERLMEIVKHDYMASELPRRPAEPWPDKAYLIHEQYWKLRIARQKEIDASIAAKAEFEQLYDKPYEDLGKVRVAGPFTVESISPYRVLNVDENDKVIDPAENSGSDESRDFTQMILENLKTAGVQQAHKEDRISFTSVDPFPAGNMISAIGKYQEGDKEKSAAIFIGPEFGTVSLEDLVEAAREAAFEHCDILVACAFNFEANAGELQNRGKMPILKARMNAELHMGEALRKTDKGNLFVVFGEPDIDIEEAGDDKIQVTINGVDVYNPSTGSVVSDNASDIACWFIDTNYNAESFFVRQAYFLGQKNPYESLKRALNAEIDKDAWESLNSRTSRPFPKPETGRIAVKVINHLGDEVMKVFKV